MTRADIKRKVIQLVAGDTIYLAIDFEMNDWINDAISLISKETPFHDDLITFMSVVGQKEYNLPANLKRVATCTWNNYVLDQVSYDEALREYQYYSGAPLNTLPLQQGPPNNFYLRQQTNSNAAVVIGADPSGAGVIASPLVFGTFPVTNDTQLFSLSGSFSLAQLVLDTDIPQFDPDYHEMIIDFVLYRIWDKSRELQLAANHLNLFQQKLEDYRLNMSQIASEVIEQSMTDLIWG